MSKTPSPTTRSLPVEIVALIGFVIITIVLTTLGLVVILGNQSNTPMPAVASATSVLTQPILANSEATQGASLGATSPSTSATIAPSSTTPLAPQTTTIASTETPSQSVSPTATPTLTKSTLGSTAAPSSTPSATPAPSDTPAASSTPNSTTSPTATSLAATATASPTLAATATPQSLNNGWRLLSYTIAPDPDQANALLIYGELQNTNTNNQEISALSGSVLNAQGQVVASGNALVSYTPVTAIPAGGRVPFEISVADAAAGTVLTLNVQASATAETWRQDLSAFELTQTNEGDDYCVKGRISNTGAVLQEALIIAVKLYDAAGRLINFSDFTPNSPNLVVGDQTLPFTICANPPNQGVAVYEIQTWGR